MSEEVEPHVSERFEILQKLGKGAYGIVWKARNKKTNQLVALKKVYDAFQNSTDAQRTYREVMYLQHLNGHENIIRLLSIIRAYNNKDLYLVFDLMETDLHIVIRAKILKPVHKQFILYQLFKSIKYIHSAEIIHRDLKPSNMLINSDCLMKLADFGLARSVAETDEGYPVVSEYIATRWYRAPEILLGSTNYTKAVDIWSAGCIIVELLTEKVLFAGKSSLNQVEQIIELLGRPTERDLHHLQIAKNNSLLSNIKTGKTKSITQLLSPFGGEVLDLVRKILIYNSEARLTVDEILEHSYFAQFHVPEEEIVCPNVITIPINDNEKLSLKIYRDAIYENISSKVKEQSKNMFIISNHYRGQSTSHQKSESKPIKNPKENIREEEKVSKGNEKPTQKVQDKENIIHKKSLGESTISFFRVPDELSKKQSSEKMKANLYKSKSPDVVLIKERKESLLVNKQGSTSLKNSKQANESSTDSKQKILKQKSDAIASSNQLMQKYQQILKNSSSNLLLSKNSTCFFFKSKINK